MPSMLPTFSPSAHDILSHVPVVKQGSRVVGALLLCIDEDLDIRYTALILTECTDTRGPQGPLYDAGGMQDSRHDRIALFDVSSDEFKALDVKWEHIYIAHRPPSRAANPQLRVLNHALFPSLQIPHPLPILYRETAFVLSPSSASGGNALILVLALVNAYPVFRHIVFRFGLCATSTAPQGPSSGVPWARLSHHRSAPSASDWDPDSHDCSRDHIPDWAQRVPGRSNGPVTRVFRLGAYWDAHHIRLSFSFSPSSHDLRILVLTEILLSGRCPDDGGDVIQVAVDGDDFWRGVKSGSSTSPSAVERAALVEERALAAGGQDDDGEIRRSEAWRSDDDDENDGDDDEDKQHRHDGNRSGRGVTHTRSSESCLSCPGSPWVEQDEAADNADRGLEPAVEIANSESVDEQLYVDGRNSGADGGVGEASFRDVREERQACGADERQARGTHAQLNEHRGLRPSRPQSPCGDSGPGLRLRDVAAAVATKEQPLGGRDGAVNMRADGHDKPQAHGGPSRPDEKRNSLEALSSKTGHWQHIAVAVILQTVIGWLFYTLVCWVLIVAHGVSRTTQLGRRKRGFT